MLPEVRLDTDTFQGLIEEYRMQIAGIYPEWTNYNYSDPGITFVELFAWMKENQQFFMEQLSVEHYRRFFKMMGLKPGAREAARVIARVFPKDTKEDIVIPAGTVYYAETIPFTTQKEERIPAFYISALEVREAGADGSYAIERSQLDPENPIMCYPFGEKGSMGSMFYIYLTEPMEAGKEYSLSFFLHEQGAKLSRKEAADIGLTKLGFQYYGQKGWTDLTVGGDTTGGLMTTGRVCLTADAPMQIFYSDDNDCSGYCLRVVLKEGVYDSIPVIEGLGFDSIELVQEMRMDCPEEGIYLGEGKGFPDQMLSLPWDGVLKDSIVLSIPDVMNHENRELWQLVDDFSEADPMTKGYAVDEINNALIFGNGLKGFPPEGDIRLMRLSTSMGFKGNIRLKTVLNHVSNSGPGGRLITQYIIKLGRNPEELDAIIQRARMERPLFTASTAEDYEYLIRQTPGLAIHSCRVIESMSNLNEVTIVVRPGSGKEMLKLSNPMKERILNFLEERRMIGTKITLESPEYIRVDMIIEYEGAVASFDNEEQVKTAIGDFFKDYGSFGDPLFYGRFYGMLDSLSSIKKISSLTFQTDSILVRRNASGDLIPPENGLFLPGEIVLNR